MQSSNPGAYEPRFALLDTLEIRTRLAESNPRAYELALADVCNNLAILLKNTDRPQEEKPLLKKALSICEQHPHLAERAKQIHNVLENLS